MTNLTTTPRQLAEPLSLRDHPAPSAQSVEAVRQSPLVLPTRPRLMLGILMFSDLAMLCLAMLGTVYGRLLFDGQYESGLYLRLFPILGLFLGVYACVGLYPSVPLSPVGELRRMTIVTSLLFLGLGMATFLFREGETYSRSVLLICWALALVLVPLSRAALRMLLAGRSWWGYPTVVVGAGICGAAVLRTLARQPEIGLKPVGILDDHADSDGHIGGVPVVGRLADGEELAQRYGVRYAIMAMPDLDPDQAEQLMRSLSRSFHHLMVIPQLSGFSSLWVSAVDLGGMLGLEVRHRLLDPGRRALKRFIDLALIVLFSPLLIPLVGLIALAIRIDSPGSVLYDQQRIGAAGRSFRIKKFRSMVVNADRVLAQYLEEHPQLREEWEATHKLRNDPRITRVGRFLRKTSLDELPQLWNVLVGHMSLVGPRPIVDDEVMLYGRDIDLIQQVCPGITGIWQVSGRNNVTYEERVGMDAYYVRNWSVWLDVYLLSRTVLAVLLCRGAY